ncbi:hypothetical protein [Prosthecobacter sp.]|jgi:hypothetical protein|uniref:hypothetical protein n=1 Tax=Prosthecobacter sp. TaxID=1965333 RepID=UPI0037CC21EC
MENEQHPDPDIARKHAIHRSCVVAVKAGVGRELYIADTIRIMNAIYAQPVTPEELGTLWDGYSQAAKENRIDEDLEHNLQMEILATGEARAWQRFLNDIGPLLEVSPVNAFAIEPLEYLRLVVPNDHRVLLSSPMLGQKAVWQNDTLAISNPAADRYWPLCVNYGVDDDRSTLERTHNAVVAWNAATTLMSADHAGALAQGITSRLLPVRDVVALSVESLCVTFKVHAESRDVWLAECRQLRTRLADFGIIVPPFRYDGLGYLPQDDFGRIVVFLDP